MRTPSPLIRLSIAGIIAAALVLHPPADAALVDPNAILVAPAKGELVPPRGEFPPIRVTFPTPMVDLDKVRRGGQPSPVVFEPTVEIRWMWLSQTEGKITFPDLFLEGNRPESAAEIFRIRHRAKLRPGLRDLAGAPVDAKTWGVEFADDQFALKGLHFLNVPSEPKEEQEGPAEPKEEPADEDARFIKARSPEAPLPARPRLRLEFSRDVTPQDVAKAVYFQDRNTGEGFPVEVNLEERQQLSPQGWFLVEPANPLPPGRPFLLVIERLREPEKGETLPVLRTVTAGTTYAPEIKDARGYNQPMKGAFLRAVGNQGIDFDPANLKLITIDPPVADLRFVALGNGVEAHGKFDTSIAYNLTFKAGLLTTDGFLLAKDSVWKTTFGPKRPAIILPDRYIFQRASAPSVRGGFVQVNTDKLEWKIAQIPREHIAEVSRRAREFGYFLRGEEDTIQTNEETGEYLYRPTELLIPNLNLPVLASGTVEASGADLETPRQWEWKPGNNDPGIFLLEISGKDLRGRQIGNRSIISRTDWMLTRLRSYESEVWRVSSMRDGEPVPGVWLEAFDFRGRSSGLWETNANGEARPKPTAEDAARPLRPWAGILAGAPGQESLHLNLPDFDSGFVYASDDRPGPLGVIVTDRNLYRPGETVKFKGFLRTLQKGRLPIAPNADVLCQIESDTEVLAHEFKTVLSETGSFEGEWKTPSSAYGRYTIRAKTAVADGRYAIRAEGAVAEITVSEFRPPPFSVVTESANVQGETVTAKVSSVHFHGAPNAGAKVRWKAEWIAENWRTDEDISPPTASSLTIGTRRSRLRATFPAKSSATFKKAAAGPPRARTAR
jgi:alpha-2-macroglobulin